MTHPLVLQLRFTRSEFMRALQGVSEEDACHRFEPMNCISWAVGHMASQEQRYFLYRAQERFLLPDIHTLFNYGAPACTPRLDEMRTAWRAITAEVDLWLEQQTSRSLAEPRPFDLGGEVYTLTYGSMLQRVIYHYWYHAGEIMAIRQLLGHRDLPEFVGDIDEEAPYLPEQSGSMGLMKD